MSFNPELPQAMIGSVDGCYFYLKPTAKYHHIDEGINLLHLSYTEGNLCVTCLGGETLLTIQHSWSHQDITQDITLPPFKSCTLHLQSKMHPQIKFIID